MSGETKTLLLLLVGPMQAWGSRSRFDDRDTGLEPTKSGVLGMICAACGVERQDSICLARFNTLKFGVRVEAPGRVMTDFHTAKDVIRASGQGRQDTVTSRRDFLADARFLVGLETPDASLLTEVITGLRNPKWTLSLGRKSFPLTLPPLLWDGAGGVRDKPLAEALKAEPWYRLRPLERDPDSLRLMIEDETAGTQTLADAPLSFVSEDRRFGLRRVHSIILRKGDPDWPALEVHPCLSPK